MLKKSLVMLLAGASVLTAQAEIDVKVTSDRPSAVYKTGEEIVFKIEATEDGKPVGANQLECFIFDVNGKRTKCALPSDGDMCIKTKSDVPGFIQLGIRLKNDKKEKEVCGVAIEPENIKQTSTEPADFDAFWEKQLKKVIGVPYKVKIDDAASEFVRFPGKIVLKEVTITSESGIVATGFMAYPANAKEKSLPLYITFNGASKVTADYKLVQGSAKFPALAFNLNFHGMSNQLDEEAVRERRREVARYQYKNADDPEKYTMRDIFLRVVLSLDYLKTNSLWDGKRLVVRGGSLGGCQALVAAALDKDVTLCVAGAAAMCNHNGTPAGWPLLLEKAPEAAETAPYFDVVNFAKRISCPVVMTVGFLDRTCVPGSTYVAYNNIPGENKKMYHVIHGGHNGKSPDKRGVFYYGTKEINAIRNPKVDVKIK